jgi:DNA helicase-2/ATP-dependent DNA helicase PcrA
MNWSEYQQAIFDKICYTGESLLVEAVAGSGKTTTLVEIINRVPEGQSMLFVAFNKAIADTLRARVTRPGALCLTLHAVGRAAWMESLGMDHDQCVLNNSKCREILDGLATWQDRARVGANTLKLIELAKGVGIIPTTYMSQEEQGFYRGLVADLDSNWEELMAQYNLDPLACSLDLARRVLLESIRSSRTTIDFNDMQYMPVVAGVGFKQFDVVLLDEAQDVNGLQVEMITRLVKPDGRLIAVGDRHQAIYGFRGALADCMDVLQDRFGATHMPLSICYRCPKLVVTHARQWVPQIEPSADAEDGILELGQTVLLDLKCFQPRDVVLCRLNRPLVTLAFRLIRARVPCKVAGRDIGKGLADLVRQLKASSIGDLEAKLEVWRANQIRRAKEDPGKIAGINDRVETLLVFIDHAASVADLLAEIEGLFVDQDPAKPQAMLMLSTVHKAKGREWDRVFILDAQEFMPVPWVKEGEWQMQQELNLCYVAATRAKRELRYIMSEGLK